MFSLVDRLGNLSVLGHLGLYYTSYHFSVHVLECVSK